MLSKRLRYRVIPVAGLILATVFLSCARYSDLPRGFSESPLEQQTNCFGAWMVIRYYQDSVPVKDRGELIAIAEDSVFWLATSGFRAVSRTEIDELALYTYLSQHGSITAWATLGTISTLSHLYPYRILDLRTERN